jgi:signal peptidase I
MPLNQLLVLFIIQSLIVALPGAGVSGMFKKAGLKPWKGWVPFYNTWLMLKLANRSVNAFFFQFIPIVGWFVSMNIFIDFAKTFGKFSFREHAMASLIPFIYFPVLGFNKSDCFMGADYAKQHKKSARREWADAAIFAIIAATLIRTFVFEAYAIPTPSMEKTMLVNDYLFVSKMAYGPRLPNTPLSIPFIQNTIPLTNTKSYLDWIRIPYIRWFPGKINRNDIIVFNMPEADTIINKDEFGSKVLYYEVIRYEGKGNSDLGRTIVQDNKDEYPLIVRPVDKEDNYVKRCVAIPGDILQIKDQVIYINGNPASFPANSQHMYEVETNGQPLDDAALMEEYDVNMDNPEEFATTAKPNMYDMVLTEWAKEKMIKNGFAKSIQPGILKSGKTGQVYPFDDKHDWSLDEFGPIWIPKKGSVLELTQDNYAIYGRVIRTYEGNRLENINGEIFINGEKTKWYRFKMDYYWMMGDNRHNSQDARTWGFVPEDHIVGKPAFTFMSYGEHGIRWNRLFRRIQ